jgi:uncharacterized membrane protein
MAAWDVFLALVPVALAYLLVWLVQRQRRQPTVAQGLAAAATGVAWLAFLPNACYLLTEWRHFLGRLSEQDLYGLYRATGDREPLLHLLAYALFFTAFSGAGVLAFAAAIRPVERLVRGRLAAPWLWTSAFFGLMALGVYLGLVLRFNSWDLLHRPGAIAAAALSAVASTKLSLIAGFAAFLWLVYRATDLFYDGLALRLAERRGSGPRPTAPGELASTGG